MARVLKYTTTTPSGSIRKGNIALSTGNADYGTSFYTGIEPPAGGYVVYQNKATGGPSIKVAADDTELINITREISGGTYGSAQECLNYYFTQSDIVVVSSNSSPGNITSDGLVLDLNVNNLPTNVQNLNNPSSKLRNWYDNTGRLTYPVSGAVNIGLPLTSWSTRRSDIALITDGSILPPNSGSAVWSSTVNTASYANTLHRMWNYGNQNGVIGSLGQGYYRYYMWVKGAPHNSPTASIQIDISDGGGSYANSGTPTRIGTGSAWQLISAWDLGGSYNADKFFDYFLSGCTSGDTYYISGITVARYNVPDSGSLVPLISFPGYIDYYSTSSVSQQGYLFNSITSNSQSLVFDGVDDYVKTSKTDFTANNDFTYELVVKSDQYLTSRGILANKGYWSLTQGAAIGNISTPQTIYGYVTTNTGHYDINSNVGPTYGWTHVIMRRSNNDLRFFINGNHQGSTRTISGTVTDDSNEFYLGSYNNGSGSPWKGNTALARVYSRALSDAEILQNYHQAPIVTDGLVFAVDAGNLVSYENGSTTTYSLTGSISGSLINGTGYSSDKGGAWVFDGVDDYITFGTQNLVTTDFTVENWFSVPTPIAPKEHYLMSIGYNSLSSLLFTLDSQINNTVGLAAYYRDAAGNVVNYGMGSGVTNQIYHSVLTRSGGTNVAYLNGVIMNTFSNSTTLGANLNLQLGWAIPRNKSTAYMNGNIYASKIYNRALSTSEVQQNYNAQRNRFGL